MKESKFTPGPWKIVDHDGYGVNVWNVAGNKCIAERCRHPDANLIASAPDMYEALKELEESIDYWSEYDVPIGIIDRIRASIAKAEGKS